MSFFANAFLSYPLHNVPHLDFSDTGVGTVTNIDTVSVSVGLIMANTKIS